MDIKEEEGDTRRYLAKKKNDDEMKKNSSFRLLPDDDDDDHLLLLLDVDCESLAVRCCVLSPSYFSLIATGNSLAAADPKQFLQSQPSQSTGSGLEFLNAVRSVGRWTSLPARKEEEEERKQASTRRGALMA